MNCICTQSGKEKYINALFNFFQLFRQRKNVNFQDDTSHSRFLVSDIPKYNLIYLDKKIEMVPHVLASADQKPTMEGQYLSSFRMVLYEEFIGEFAFNMINEAINFLNGIKSQFSITLLMLNFFYKIDRRRVSELQRVTDKKKIKDFTSILKLLQMMILKCLI
jgi:hypothetical protein